MSYDCGMRISHGIVAICVCLSGCKGASTEASPAPSASGCGLCDLDPNYDKAKAYKAECEKGSAVACHYVGRMYENGSAGLSKDPEQARAHYERACKGGHEIACKYARTAGSN